MKLQHQFLKNIYILHVTFFYILKFNYIIKKVLFLELINFLCTNYEKNNVKKKLMTRKLFLNGKEFLFRCSIFRLHLTLISATVRKLKSQIF